MLLAIAVVYYLRRGNNSSNADLDFRNKFRNRLYGACGRREADVEEALIRGMDALIEQTHLEDGIARTRGLQENMFMVVGCCLAEIPVMIVGPPDSSKTLAVTVVAKHARGEYSKSSFYNAIPSLVQFHYQCSRRSTSNETKLSSNAPSRGKRKPTSSMAMLPVLFSWTKQVSQRRNVRA